MSSSFVHPEFIVETEWLARALDDPGVRVLDCTQHLIPRPGNVRNDIKPGLEHQMCRGGRKSR